MKKLLFIAAIFSNLFSACSKSPNSSNGGTSSAYQCVCHISWPNGAGQPAKDSTATYPSSAQSQCDSIQKVLWNRYGAAIDPGAYGAKCSLQ